MALKINNKVLVALDKASNQFSNTVFDAIKDERGVHLETAISAPCFLAQMKKDKTPREQHAYVAALTEMKILRMGAANLSPEIGKALALYSLVSGSKTVPELLMN